MASIDTYNADNWWIKDVPWRCALIKGHQDCEVYSDRENDLSHYKLRAIDISPCNQISIVQNPFAV